MEKICYWSVIMNTVVENFPIDAIIMAGGLGERMKLGYSKVLLSVNNKTLLEYCIEQTKSTEVNNIYIICDDAMQKECEKYAKSPHIHIYRQNRRKNMVLLFQY